MLFDKTCGFSQLQFILQMSMTFFLNQARRWNRKKYTKAQSTAECCPRCFSVYGFSGASLDEIAQLANMHKSNIFYYYENKESLYVEVLTTVLQSGLAPLQIGSLSLSQLRS